MKHWALAIIVLSSAFACEPSDNCTPGASRCAGQTAEVCDNDHNWKKQLDCAEVSRQSNGVFACEYVSADTEDGHVEGYTCVPASGVAGGAS